MRRGRASALVAFAVWAGLTIGAVVSVEAQCTYTALTSGTTATVSTSPQPLSFNQAQNFYTAVGVRPPAGGDWNIGVYQSQTAAPACVATLLGSSTRTSGVDFVIGDFNAGHDAVGIYYPQVTQVSGSGSATVEWDDGPNSLAVNGPLVSRTTGATNVLEVWDVSLVAGNTYNFTFNPTGASLKLLLFKSGAGVYWAGRDTRLFEVTSSTTFTPSTSGFYGVVVVNDDGASGSYTMGVGTCSTPVALTSGVVDSKTAAERYYTIDQTSDFFWTAVGVRGASDWNLEVYGSPSGGTYPTCFTSVLGSSSLAAPTVDFVVANFNNAILAAPYGVRVHLNNDLGSGSGTVEWDDGGTVNDVIDAEASPPTPAITRTTGPNDVLECWDMYMTQGTQYQFFLSSSGPPVKLFLFPATMSWGSRSDAILQVTAGTTAVPFTATTTGFHGVVVVNEDGTAGTYELRVYAQGGQVAVDESIPSRNLFDGVEPNPAHGPAAIRFGLAQPARVGFEVLDAAGRRVAGVPERAWSAGRWSATWDGRGHDGSRLSPGIYFVRMLVDGQPMGLRKVAVLN